MGHGVGDEGQPQRRHAHLPGLVPDQVVEDVDNNPDGWDTILAFHVCNMADDRRRTGASMADCHYHQAVLGLDLGP